KMRKFQYDSLSRLLWSQNPETGVIFYGQGNGTVAGCQANGYDANVNLLYKTDARGRTTSQLYDPLDRLFSKTASDGSFAYTYTYDETGHSYPLGRVTTASTNVNTTVTFNYDPMGRINQESYCVPTDCSYSKQISATYDPAGNLVTLTYPDGRTITQDFADAGRLSSVTYTGWNGN